MKARHTLPDDDDDKGKKGGGLAKYIAGFTLLIIVGLCVMNSTTAPAHEEGLTAESLHGEGPMSHGHEHEKNSEIDLDLKAAEAHAKEKRRLINKALDGEHTTQAPGSTTASTRDKDTIARLKLHSEATQKKTAEVAASAVKKFGKDSPHVINHRPHWNTSASWWVKEHAKLHGEKYKALDEDMADPTLINLPDFGGGMVMMEGDGWLVYPHTIDDVNMCMSIWIYLSEVDWDDMPPQSPSAKTIVSTKMGGCYNRGDLSDGFALYVHKHGTLNRQLRLQWSDMESACVELYSEDDLVPYNHWTLVGFSLSKQTDTARLFMGNKIIAHTKKGIGRISSSTHKGRTRTLNVDLRGRHVRSEEKERLHGGLMSGLVQLGAMVPDYDDKEHTTAHGFIGFFGDMRSFRDVPDDDEDFLKVLSCPVDEAEALIQEIEGKDHIRLIMQSDCTVGEDTTFTGDEVGGSYFNTVENHKQKFTTEPDDSVMIHFLPWEVHPKSPAEIENDILLKSEHQVSPTFSPDEVRGSWLPEYTEKFTEQQLMESQRKSNVWADEVKSEMLHCWGGYRRRGWHHDGNTPITGKKTDFFQAGFTGIDAAGTLNLMRIEMGFEQVDTWLKKNYIPKYRTDWDPDTPLRAATTQEYAGRILGSLLGAYCLSDREMFLERARSVARFLYESCNGPAGLPMPKINIAGARSVRNISVKWGDKWGDKHSNLADAGGIQMEMRMLSRLTMDGKYKVAGDKAFESLLTAGGNKGIIPTNLTAMDAVPKFVGNKRISMGRGGDRYYEYLLKQYIQTGKREEKFKAHWVHAMDAMMSSLVLTTKGGRMFISEREETGLNFIMDHLACAVPGHLMLGLHHVGKEMPVQKRMVYRETAEGLMATCYEMYRSSPSGLAGEAYKFHLDRSDDDMELYLNVPNATYNRMRPEVIESLYYMHYYTGDPKYREWGYNIFKAWRQHCKAKWGYAILEDVRLENPKQIDWTETWFMSETIKYLYLLFRPRSEINLDEWVFNGDGHPFKIWKAGFIIPDFDEREELPPRFDSMFREGAWSKDYPTWYVQMGDLGMKM